MRRIGTNPPQGLIESPPRRPELELEMPVHVAPRLRHNYRPAFSSVQTKLRESG